jgi:prephenate dehydrogenase
MKIVIVGLGVIGGGYAMALKDAGYTDVYGVDKDVETLKKAKALGIIKEGYKNENEIIKSADLIVLAIYHLEFQIIYMHLQYCFFLILFY